jgi:hypothetical protein
MLDCILTRRGVTPAWFAFFPVYSRFAVRLFGVFLLVFFSKALVRFCCVTVCENVARILGRGWGLWSTIGRAV